jgi:hypothetical protein
MRSLVFVCALLFAGTAFASGDCVNGSCRQPVEKTAKVVKSVLVAPKKVVKTTVVKTKVVRQRVRGWRLFR